MPTDEETEAAQGLIGGEQPTESSDDVEEVTNVKEAWRSRYIYLPDKVNEDIDDEFDRLRYEASREFDEWRPGKIRHFYPVLGVIGIRGIRDIEIEAFVEEIESLPEKLDTPTIGADDD